MTSFTSFAELRAVCLDLPSGHPAASAAVAQREDTLTKPPKSLGRLEELVAFLAHWQGHAPPKLDRVDILVFAGNHGVTAAGRLGLSVRSHGADGGELCLGRRGHQPARAPCRREPQRHSARARPADARLHGKSRARPKPNSSPRCRPASTRCRGESDLICLGEMGIGNTSAAAALAAALFGGGGARWAGRGTGVDDDGLQRKRSVIDCALARHAAILNDPLRIAAAFGGRELAAILGAALGGAALRHSGSARRLRLHRRGRAAL